MTLSINIKKIFSIYILEKQMRWVMPDTDKIVFKHKNNNHCSSNKFRYP